MKDDLEMFPKSTGVASNISGNNFVPSSKIFRHGSWLKVFKKICWLLWRTGIGDPMWFCGCVF